MKTAEEKLIYEAYLNSPQWEAKRQELAIARNFTCESCGVKITVGFHAHHKHYRTLTEERLTDLMFLCPACHTEIHKVKNKVRALCKQSNKAGVKKGCYNCKFSQQMKFVTSAGRKHNGKAKNNCKGYSVLYCNLRLDTCDKICEKYKHGAEKKYFNKAKGKKMKT